MDLEQGQDRVRPHSDDRPWPDIRLWDTDRLEPSATASLRSQSPYWYSISCVQNTCRAIY